MNRNVLGAVAAGAVVCIPLVVVFCITFWVVAGEAMQASKQAQQAEQQAKQSMQQARRPAHKAQQAAEKAKQAFIQTTELNNPVAKALNQAVDVYAQAVDVYDSAVKAWKQAEKASITADAHWRMQAAWGIGAGLLADVLLLVGVVEWWKLTAKA